MSTGKVKKLWDLVMEHFTAAEVDQSHPFKLINLATQGAYPEVRTVVLREIDHDRHIWIYSDSRTPKVSQIRKNQNISILAYHPISRIQVRMRGKARLYITGEKYAQARQGIQHSLGDYNSLYPPGTDMVVDKKSSYVHFILIELIPTDWDILQLSDEGYFRAKYVNINEQWRGYEVVP